LGLDAGRRLFARGQAGISLSRQIENLVELVWFRLRPIGQTHPKHQKCSGSEILLHHGESPIVSRLTQVKSHDTAIQP
jgi:hypothetical protein